MPAYTRDPRTLRGVRPNAVAVRPDYWLPSAITPAVPTGRWVLLSLQDLTEYARYWGEVRPTGLAYAGMFAYPFQTRDGAMAAARHVLHAAASREAQKQENWQAHLEFQASLPASARRTPYPVAMRETNR